MINPISNKIIHPCCKNSDKPVVGIDEVGRGSLIGDVVAAAVIFHSEKPEGLKDSKKLSAKKREMLDIEIRKSAHVSIGSANIDEINEYGITKATMAAMARAWIMLPWGLLEEDVITIIDGNQKPNINGQIILLDKADELCPTVSAASIIAKVYRDNAIIKLHEEYPEYEWNKNKGYGTKKHMARLYEFGYTKYHRTSFEPIKSLKNKI